MVRKRESADRQTDQEEIKKKTDLRFSLCAPLGVWVFGLRDALEWGMTARSDGGTAQREPLGGCRDGADSPSRKLIIENMGKSYYCGCNWGTEEITWQSECQRNHSGLGRENIRRKRQRERKKLLTLAHGLNIHHCHTRIVPKYRTDSHTLLWKAPKKRIPFIIIFFKAVPGSKNTFFLKVTPWKQIIEWSLKTTSKAGSEDAFKDNVHKQGGVRFRQKLLIVSVQINFYITHFFFCFF